jgi:hypothetical protein
LVVSSAFDFDISTTRGTKAEGAGESQTVTTYPRDWLKVKFTSDVCYMGIFSV